MTAVLKLAGAVAALFLSVVPVVTVAQRHLSGKASRQRRLDGRREADLRRTASRQGARRRQGGNQFLSNGTLEITAVESTPDMLTFTWHRRMENAELELMREPWGIRGNAPYES
jgi:hypothetical protein